MHLCWGNYPEPHHCEVALAEIADIGWQAKPRSPYIEHPDLIAQRLGCCADLLGQEQVMAGVDCGFPIHAGGNALGPEIVWAKLAALAEGASLASRKYW